MKYIITISWSTVLIIMIVIFRFSAQPAAQSNEVSKELTGKIVDTLPQTKDLPVEQKQIIISEFNSIVRKYAHFLLYLLLGLALMLAMKFSFYDKNNMYLWLSVILICLLYAVSDEVHQIFVPGRGCQLIDVLIDFCGSLIGSGISMVLIKIFCK